MCLLVMVSRVDAQSPLVVGANRDERLDRPATAMTVLQSEGPRILGGRDELAGGTWLAVNEHGVVAALTNRPAPEGRDPSKRSRGELPLALAQHAKASEAVRDFAGRFDPADFNPSWLLVGDREALFSIDMSDEGGPVVRQLRSGVHVLENVPLTSNSQKADHVRELLGEAGESEPSAEGLVDRLREVLADHSLPPGAHLDADGDSPGERPVETLAACVHAENYGTRSSTIVRVPLHREDTISVSVADGAPCQVPFTDVSGLWK